MLNPYSQITFDKRNNFYTIVYYMGSYHTAYGAFIDNSDIFYCKIYNKDDNNTSYRIPAAVSISYLAETPAYSYYCFPDIDSAANTVNLLNK